MKIHMTHVSGCGYLWSCPYLRPLSLLPLSPSHFIHCFGLSLKSKPEKTRECFNFEKYSAFFVLKGFSHNEEKEEVGNTYYIQNVSEVFMFSVCAYCSQSLENQDTGFEFPILGILNIRIKEVRYNFSSFPF